MDVFSQRVALPTSEKLAVLACGGAMAARNFVTRNFATRNSATRNRVDK
jgi:hypothetical protein